MNPAGLHLRLGTGEVHVWWIDLTRVTEGDAVLSPEERARTARFRQPRDRQRWRAAHVALRQILAHYTAISPEAVRLGTRAQGKPALLDEPSLCFNLSHAGERAALAVAWQREVGIDLEALAADLPGLQDLDALVASTCTPTEAAWIASLPLADRRGAFLKLWTLKEAYLKGIGAGLAVEPRTVGVIRDTGPSPGENPHPQPLAHRNGRGEPDVETDRHWRRVSTSTAPSPGSTGEGGRGVRVLAGEGPGLAEQPWSLCLLNSGPEWVAALAVAGPQWDIAEYHWPPLSRVNRTSEAPS